ncbi:Ribosomal protein S18 acetylase RimI [Lentzea xinjiangensis]|uniref:Ribosomal protein S18 acetylase RimI n=1 Tax=Lentzea xinjiangensis TaxID=402600 RepID=A0A1H9A2N7_9PSEU|nr:GNAT family N-acetyltransferase [Lentzea xinjiangensis]SEP70781.1 Ribosomal protein S18 acetylase RimI [Lentzea xinjiangensis]
MKALRAELERQWAEGSIDSEPRLAAEAVLELVAGDEPPLRLLLGSTVYDLAFDISRRRMDTWAGWDDEPRRRERPCPPRAPGHAEGVENLIRRAGRADVPALVRLRLANAERHVELAPDLFRVPDEAAVRRHFEAVVGHALILVAEVDGEVVGMAEVVPLADPPDHQILTPRRAADIHTVVLDGHRDRGVGTALVAAAERVAAEHGVSLVFANIFASNENALAFYSGAGFGPRGILLSKACD